MATAIVISDGEYVSRGVYRQVWDWSATTALAATATGFGNPAVLSNYVELTVEVFGPTGGSTNVLVEGALLATGPYHVLESVTSGAMNTNSAVTGKLFTCRTTPIYVRPRASTVTGGATPYVSIVAR
jgi:hypothetical protein|tara:strand:+ start:4663 stop:5043 length:381 start_codon:yes stop_codon:yes gene_type:complete